MVALPFCRYRLIAEKPTDFRHFNDFGTLGEQIRKRRLELGLKQRELAKMIGVSNATASKWELNFSNPEFSYLAKIYEFLGHEPESS